MMRSSVVVVKVIELVSVDGGNMCRSVRIIMCSRLSLVI